MKNVLTLIFVAALIFGALFTSKFQPDLVAANDYKTYYVTRSTSLAENAKRRFNRWFEVSPACTYEILGWDTTDQLFYKQNCVQNATLFRYDLATNVSDVVKITSASLLNNPIDNARLTDLVTFRNPISPPEAEYMTRNLYFEKGTGIYSQSERYLVFLQKALYSEQSVSVIDFNSKRVSGSN